MSETTEGKAASAVPAPEPGRPRTKWDLVPIWAWFACVVSWSLRLLVGDEWPIASTIVYALPPLVMTPILGGVALAWYLRGRRKFAGYALAWMLLTAAVAVFTGFVRASPAPSTDPAKTIRGMFWNVQRGSGGWDNVVREVGDVNPDVAWFVESHMKEETAPRWDTALSGYETRSLPGNLSVAVRGRILGGEILDLEGGSASVVHFQVRETRFSTIVVDISSNPFRHRGGALRRLDGHRPRFIEQPLLVAGDFNTPRDSAHFGRSHSLLGFLINDERRIRRTFRHAFEAAGRGYHATWPWPFPFLAIDHVWGNDRIRFRSCTLRGSGASDHRAIVVEFDVTR